MSLGGCARPLRRFGPTDLLDLTKASHQSPGGRRSLSSVSATAKPPEWPADPGHREAIETLLVMAESDARWGDPRHALDLLDQVETIVGPLPQRYEHVRTRCRSAVEEPSVF